MENPIYLTPIVKSEDIANEQRYDLEEIPFIDSLVLGAQALLFNAGAFKPNNPLTITVIKMIVGFWLENREGMTSDNRSVEGLPFGITAMITSLVYFVEPAKRGGVNSEESESERHETQNKGL